MNKIFIIALFAVGCVPTKPQTKSNIIVFERYYDADGSYNLEGTWNIIEIDSCEYIKGWGGEFNGGPFLTHKGNCKNKKHQYK